MDPASEIARSGINRRARFTRAMANILMHHSFPGCGKVLRNAYKLFGPPPAGPLRIETRYGFDILVNPKRNRGVDSSIYYNGTYEAGTLSVILGSLRKGDTLVDAGANIGLMSLAAAQKVGPGGAVHAFEPVPDVFSQLQQNAVLNNTGNIHVHNLALGSVPEKRMIYEQAGISKGVASLVQPTADSSGIHSVNVDTLDRVCDASGIRTIRMIKADVEGWELELLQGSKRLLSADNAPILCIEYCVSILSRRGQLHDVYHFLRNINKYQFFKLKNGKETISPLVGVISESDLPRCDNLFCFLPQHLAEIREIEFA